MTKPSAIKRLAGAYKKDPGRENKNEPKPRYGIGEAPDFFTDEKQKIWDEIVSQMAPGVLTNMDRIWLEQAVELLYKARTGDIPAAERTILMNSLNKLGMNPVERQKISVKPSKAKNEWDDL